MTPIRKQQTAVAKPESHRSKKLATIDNSFIAGGTVGAMHAEISGRLSGAEYEAWLLPPEVESRSERVIRWLSRCAGIVALTGGLAIAWMLLG